MTEIPFDIKITKLTKGFNIQYLEDTFAVGNLEGLFKEIRRIFGINDRMHGPKKSNITNVIDSKSPDGDNEHIQPEQKSQDEINPVLRFTERPIHSELTFIDPTKITKEDLYLQNEGSNSITIDNLSGQKEQVKEPVAPFTEIPGFDLNKDMPYNDFEKSKVQFKNKDEIAISRSGYPSVLIFTTTEEIKRIKSLPEMDIKLLLVNFEKKTYQNKATVFRQFLRDLKDVNDLKIPVKPERTFPKTFYTMKEVDEIKNK